MAEEIEGKDTDDNLRVGVIGFSDEKKFEIDDALDAVEEAFDEIEKEYVKTGEFAGVVVVSGLSAQGISQIAYELADERGYKTVGFVPEQILDFETYDVDEIIFAGKNFGDESRAFIDYIDILVKIGGGKQSEAELDMAEKDELPIIEIDL